MIISHSLLSSVPSGDRDYVKYEFVHDDAGGRVDIIEKLVPQGFDTTADRISMIPALEQAAADEEIGDAISRAEAGQNPDLVPPLFQDQNDYDRRVLGRCMQFADVQAFYASLPMWQAMEGRGGSNANQRAAYLEIPRVPYYDEMSARYGDVQGIAFFLDSDAVWEDLPAEFD